MAVATAPTIDLAAPHIACELVDVPRPAPRWGAPIWPAEEPIAALVRPPVTQVDAITLSLMLSHRSV